jgi:site-specific DNA-methyltransferase (adenine-specific)
MEIDNIYNMDCLEGMKQIPDGTIDAVICDLPYGTMKGAALDGWEEDETDWDEIIPTAPLFEQYERVLRRGGVAILFSQEPYTRHLRTFRAKNINFLYPMIWLKNNHANALLSKNAPVSRFEDINVFAKANPLHDYDLAHPLRPYFAKVMEYIGKPRKQVIETIGQNADHTFRCNSSQFALCTAETYRQLIDVYGIDKMDGYRTYEDLKAEDDTFVIVKEHERTFNLPEGEKSLSNVLEFSKDTDGFHPTQKPVALIRRLVLTYTNEGDTVLDNCMGSGTTAIACIKERRHFIGFELSKEYFDKAVRRIKAEQAQLTLF